MVQEPFFLVSSVILIIWGVMHMGTVRSILAGFGEVSPQNKRIFVMEWIGGGLILVFLGGIIALVTLLGTPGSPEQLLVVWASVVICIALAGLSLLTGARTRVILMKLYPWVLIFSAFLLVMGIGK
jgi:hypothetical protein